MAGRSGFWSEKPHKQSVKSVYQPLFNMDDNSNKRFLIIAFLLSINLLFAIKELSLATGFSQLNSSFSGDDSSKRGVLIPEGELLSQTILPQVNHSALRPEVMDVTVTAYTSRKEETDSTPFITASGSYTRNGVVASSFLPMGSKIKLPALFGNRIFVVEDTMSARYDAEERIDIWLPDANQAKLFGVKSAKAEIL